MGVTEWAYFGLLALIALERLLELYISKRNQRRMASRGIQKISEPHFPWMVAVHTALLVGAGLEVWLFRRPFLLWLAIPMFVLFFFAQAMRVWVVRTMSGHWNAEIMDSTQLGVVTGGPYRWVRHPNYVAVVAEFIAIPLLHTAWITAVAGSLADLWVLRSRIDVEDRVLLSSPVYRAAMGSKPRFLPRFF
jgi:methyltransferase